SVLLRANADPIEIGFPFQILQAVEHLAHIVGAAMAGPQQKIFPPPPLIERVVPPGPLARDATRGDPARFFRRPGPPGQRAPAGLWGGGSPAVWPRTAA